MDTHTIQPFPNLKFLQYLNITIKNFKKALVSTSGYLIVKRDIVAKTKYVVKK